MSTDTKQNPGAAELPAVGPDSICRYCGRHYPDYGPKCPALVNCPCPEDDCPSHDVKVKITRWPNILIAAKDFDNLPAAWKWASEQTAGLVECLVEVTYPGDLDDWRENQHNEP